MTVQCPQCRYTRQPADTAPDYACPSCGIVYAKHDPQADLARRIEHAKKTGNWLVEDAKGKAQSTVREKAKSPGVLNAVRAYAASQPMKRKAIFGVVASLVVLAIFGNIMNNIEASRKEAAEQAARAEKRRLAQERRAALEAEFATSKQQLLYQAQRMIDQAEPDAALSSLARFAQFQYPEVIHLQALAQTAKRVKVLSDELANKPDAVRAMAIYQDLATLEPSNPLWPAMVEQVKPMVSRETRKDEWPLTVSSGELGCERNAVTFRANGITYAINGPAMARGKYLGWRDIREIWKDNPAIPGTKINIGPMIEKGLLLCK
jgi:hypothetical protein